MADAGSITLNSFSYLGNSKGWCEDADRTLTVAVKGTSLSKSARLQDIRSGAWLTISGLDFAVSKDCVLQITLARPSTSTANMTFSLAAADIYGHEQNSGMAATNVAWSGVQTSQDVADLKMNDTWSYQAPLVKLNVTTTAAHATPEPVTATLSLLALAGFAARRRK